MLGAALVSLFRTFKPMIKRYFTVLFSAAILLCSPTSHAESREAAVSLQLPPQSLARWYKPANKRQIWLHTMFRLRQALQAVELYAGRGDRERLMKWAEELRHRYATLAEMVPEWSEKTRQSLAVDVLESAEQGTPEALAASLKRLKRKCAGCHKQWKGIVTALYRSPDYAEVPVPEWADQSATEFPEAMERMADSLNRLKIAREDGELDLARQATQLLGKQLQQLKGSCEQCHREPQSRERILGTDTDHTLAALEESLRQPHDPKQSGHHLGTLGFTVCGRCHSIHRAMSDLRERIFD